MSLLALLGGCTPSALVNLRRGCDQGSSRACFALGVAYYEGQSEQGQPVELDYKKARRAFGQGCQRGSGSACYNLGYMGQKGEGGGVDRAAAVGAFRQGCALLDWSACLEAGRAYRDGIGVGRDLLLVNQFAKPACDHGEQAACALVVGSQPAAATASRPAAAPAATELTQLEQSCTAGSGESCFLAASRYDDGRGTAIDKARAAQLYKRACDQRDLRGCHNHGVMLLEGEGLAVNLAGGFRLLNRACEGGVKKSCQVMVSKLETACSQSRDADACTVIGRFYVKGDKGLLPSLDKGVEYLRRGCQLGDRDGCDDLRKLGITGP